AGVAADSELPPVRLASQELEGLRDGWVDVVERHDGPKVDPARLRGRRQDRADGVRHAPGERQTREREVARLQRGHEVVIEAEVFGEDSQDLTHRPTTKPAAGSYFSDSTVTRQH